MPAFLSGSQLLETIKQKTMETKNVLWICSPHLGSGAHSVLSQNISKSPPVDTRLIFNLNEAAVKQGETDPYEAQYLLEHIKDSAMRSIGNFHSNIYIFDDSAVVTSATFTLMAFESNIEVGVLLECQQLDEIRRFFETSLWQTAKPISDLTKLKNIWNLSQKNLTTGTQKKLKTHTKVSGWTDDQINTWYMGITANLPHKTERKIKKETNWANVSIVGDVGYQAFKTLKLGDLAFIANLASNRSQIEIKLAKIFDKSRVETDQGDHHLAYQTVKQFYIERKRLLQILATASIQLKHESLLSTEQQKQMESVLSSSRRKATKKKRKNKVENPTQGAK
jgi:hypothetical protein